jgi:transcriptional regulator with XRE-family HTH domain
VSALSDESQKRKNQIKRLQENLAPIRKIAGWTAEQLGDKIGVTKQTISNLENKKTPMNVAQYIAIRSVLDYEMEMDKDNTALRQVIDVLLDKGDELDEIEYEKARDEVSTVSISAAGGVTGKTLATILSSIFSVSTVGVLTFGTAYWLKKILEDKDKGGN